MLPSGTRRQNRSCDQCRRAKRRCLPPNEQTSQSLDNETCRSCEHLRHNCTYVFARSRAASSRVGAKATQNTAQPRSTVASSPPRESPQEEDAQEYNLNMIDPFPSSGRKFSGTISSDIFSAFAPTETFNLDEFLVGAEAIFDFSAFAMPSDSLDSRLDHRSGSNTGPATCAGALTPPLSEDVNSSNVIIWPHSTRSNAMSLLAFKFPIENQEQDLADVFNSMMGALSSRCLHSGTNIFAASIRSDYDIRPEGISPSTSYHDDLQAESGTYGQHLASHVTGHRHNPATPSPLPERPEVTMIGLCLYLDHFAPFYGSWSEKNTKDAHLATFQSVARAFALHSFPNSMPGASEYRAAWHQAFDELQVHKGNPSFVFIYAVLLFTLTTPPENEDGSHTSDYDDCRALLEHALYQFQRLQGLVSKHCGRLHHTSNYRSLLLKALTAFHWYCFLRDTVEALMDERDPILQSTVDEMSDLHMSSPQVSAEFDAQQVATFCRKAIAIIVILMRRCLKLATVSRIHAVSSAGSSRIASALVSCVNLIDQHNNANNDFLALCFQNFHSCDNEVKISIVFRVVLWNFGVLSFCDIVRQNVHMNADFLGNVEIKNRFQRLRSMAVDSFVELARLISEDPSQSLPLADSTAVRLPMLAHHSNTKMITYSVKKAVQNLLDLETQNQGMRQCPDTVLSQSTPLTILNATHARHQDPDSLRSLMWCLMSLQATASGKVHVQNALDTLLSDWGDLLQDCWIVSGT